MLLSSNRLRINSSSILKLYSKTRIFQPNEAIICIRRKLSSSRSPYKSNQGSGQPIEDAGEYSKVFGVTNPDLNRSITTQDVCLMKLMESCYGVLALISLFTPRI